MNKIELKIDKDGYIICIYNKNERTKYIDYRVILKELDSLSKIKNKKLSIINNTISFSYKDTIVTIENYSNNKDSALNNIIESLILEKIEKRKKELRKRKIKRVQSITVTVSLLATVLTVSATCKNIIENFMNNIEYTEPKYTQTETVNYNRDSTYLALDTESVALEDENKEFAHKEVIEVKFESRTDSEKFKVTKAYYKDIITKISKRYGIDPQIMIAIATQECGTHIIDHDAPAVGLMQIEKSVWDNQSITAFNYETNENETVYITTESLEDLEFNIKVACMHFQKCLKDSKNNLPLAIQMYNYGYGNINNTLKMCYNETIDLSNVELLNDNDWLNYREFIKVGDNLYLERILSYIEDLDNIKIKTKEGTLTYAVNNISNTRAYLT